MLDCTEFWALLSAYLDGDLTETVRVEFEAHMETCEDARALFRTFERTITLHRSVSFVEAVPDDVRRRLDEALAACISERRRREGGDR